MAGVFDLRTPGDLYEKLGRELRRMRAAADKKADWWDHVDTAFNFFVTAEHLPDWIHPGKRAKKQREKMRQANPLTRIVSHLASGAKHFDLLSDTHKSVVGSGLVHAVPPAPSLQFLDRPVLVVGLMNREAEELGLVQPPRGQPRILLQGWIEVLRLAEQVHLYWGRQLGLAGPVTGSPPVV